MGTTISGAKRLQYGEHFGGTWSRGLPKWIDTFTSKAFPGRHLDFSLILHRRRDGIFTDISTVFAFLVFSHYQHNGAKGSKMVSILGCPRRDWHRRGRPTRPRLRFYRFFINSGMHLGAILP